MLSTLLDTQKRYYIKIKLAFKYLYQLNLKFKSPYIRFYVAFYERFYCKLNITARIDTLSWIVGRREILICYLIGRVMVGDRKVRVKKMSALTTEGEPG